MKKFYGIIFFGFLMSGLVVTMSAQDSFDSKKRTGSPVNTTSLKAKQIKGSRNANARSASLSPSIVKKTQPLAKPAFGQPRTHIIYSKDTGLPSFINSPRINSGARAGFVKNSSEATMDYLQELSPVLQLNAAQSDFAITNIRTDNSNHTTVRLEQMYKGVPVYGAEVIVHLNEFGEGESFNGKYVKIDDQLDYRPSLSDNAAIQKVSADLSRNMARHALTEKEKQLVQYADPKATLVVYQDNGLVKTNVLAYHVIYCPSVYERWEYMVDAKTGNIIHQFESTCAVDGARTATGLDLNGTSRTVNTYQFGTQYLMLDISRTMYVAAGSVLPDEPIGGILTIDMNNTFGDNQTVQHAVSSNNTWTTATQTKALSAHFNAGFAYEYFRSKHLRNSIDGNGGTIISIVNVPDEDGTALDNAFWNGKAMFYGNGNVGFKPLAGALDAAGHELTHGVVENTANLDYEGESGAINESMADVFGSMMDPGDWLIGEDVVKTSQFPSGALRSLSDPHNGGTSLGTPGYQPAHTNEKYTGTQDNGGVHINSGIPNRAFYLYATAITREKAAAVYYLALTDYLTKSSQFVDLRLAIIQAATDLYGAGSTEVTQAGLAFDQVGIGSGTGGEYEEDLPSNPGTEFMLVYNTDTSDPNTLYRSNLDGTQVNALTTTEFFSKPSITDKGDVAVFVAADHTIKVITTSPGSEIVENTLQNEEIWSNAVVSKGGSKIAAVTTDEEPKIYVYDFASDEWGVFDLYNPTYSEGVNSAGPVYADALEWDYNGEFLVYDCFNRIDNASGADIEYWDVNFIHVWDNEAQNFADGTIEKLFSSLPDGVSIGNPSFSKNSPYILAFDYVDNADESYAILGCNVETNDVNVIAENNTLGWPSYNKTDERVAYTTLDESEEYQTSYILLNDDKISALGTEVGLFLSTKWPVYFATGSRVIGDEVITDVPDEVTAETGISCYPNPVQREMVVHLKDPVLVNGRIELVNSIGQQIYDFTSAVQSDQEVNVNLENLKPGYYFMKVTNAKKSGTCKLIKK